MRDILNQIPAMKAGEELLKKLEILPTYDSQITFKSIPERLIALSDIYNIYIPNRMSVEIYSKLYLAMIRALQNKCSNIAIQQKYENNKAVKQKSYSGLIGGCDSFTIIGESGIGKSSAISRAIELIGGNSVIKTKNPYTQIIPCIVVQCPFDSSIKGLLLEILRKVDETLESNYYTNALRSRATTDMLVGSVSQVALNHIGLLVVDEIQNVVNSKNGKSLIGSLTQLINNSGISIAMVGLSESRIFFEQAMQLARRSLGLEYTAMKYNKDFFDFCSILLSYQYVKQSIDISDAMIHWIYEHSGGNASIVVSLIHDAQEIAILSGKDKLDIDVLNEAYEKRLSLLHEYIQPSIVKKQQTSRTKRILSTSSFGGIEVQKISEEITIEALVKYSKIKELNIAELLHENSLIEEVAL